MSETARHSVVLQLRTLPEMELAREIVARVGDHGYQELKTRAHWIVMAGEADFIRDCLLAASFDASPSPAKRSLRGETACRLLKRLTAQARHLRAPYFDEIVSMDSIGPLEVRLETVRERKLAERIVSVVPTCTVSDGGLVPRLIVANGSLPEVMDVVDSILSVGSDLPQANAATSFRTRVGCLAREALNRRGARTQYLTMKRRQQFG